MNNQPPLSHRLGRLRRATERSGTQAPMPAVGSRTQATPSLHFLQRHRLRRRREDENTLSESLNTVQEAVDRLNEASSNLNSLLDEPNPRILNPDILTSEYAEEAAHNRKRAKRRKPDTPDTQPTAFMYGYRGQVIPGPLQMNIVSCDGGHISDHSGHSKITHYWPQNILRNDKSVYCTESSECNIIYQHMGQTPFSLKKVVIKAPRYGFDAPIQEGMIFVSMSCEDLLSRTSYYQLRESTPPTLSSSRDPSESHREALITLEPPSWQREYPWFEQLPREEGADYRPPSRRAAYPSAHVIAIPPERMQEQDLDSQSLRLSERVFPLVDLGDDSSPPPLTVMPPVTYQFHVDISCEDPSGDEEEESSPAVLADLADRCRREYPLLTSSSSEDDEEEGQSRALRRRIRRLRASPRKIEWNVTEAKELDGTTSKVGPEMLAPHAKFFIDSKMGTVSVKFDPPVSGRFILFKLWSPAEGQNIDIQSITCYGYAGPRFFPSIQMM